jgi:hypothetical protein
VRISAARSGLVALGLLVGGCGSDPSSSTGSGDGLIRAEAACDLKGLVAPLRQTVILVDARAIHKVKDAAEFAKNVDFRDLVLSIADPVKAVDSGTTAPRERIIIAVVPSDGSAASTAFTGCLPGLSADELAKANSEQSALGSAFSSSPAGQIEKDAAAFRLRLIGGMVAAAGKADGAPSTQRGPIDGLTFLQGVRSSRALLDSRNKTQRLVLISDLSGAEVGSIGADGPFAAGAAAGNRAGGDFALSEIHVALPKGRVSPDREFLRGYFLAQQGLLVSSAAGRIGPPTPAPIRVRRFAGEVAYPSGPQLTDIRIGEDAKGNLAGSWLTLLGDPRFAVPLTGQISCARPDSCRVASDNAGFAQIWTGKTGGPPSFSNQLPFGGMRNFDLRIEGDRLTGRAFDPDVYLGADKSKNSIAISAAQKQ